MSGDDVASSASESDQLRSAQAAFEQGDYATTRKLARGLHESADAELRKAAQHLIDRLSPSPLSRYLLALTFAVLCLVTAFAYLK